MRKCLGLYSFLQKGPGGLNSTPIYFSSPQPTISYLLCRAEAIELLPHGEERNQQTGAH
ncbi:hypothetical protein BDW66DRAFT_146045 [Aspergillus desertorum]